MLTPLDDEPNLCPHGDPDDRCETCAAQTRLANVFGTYTNYPHGEHLMGANEKAAATWYPATTTHYVYPERTAKPVTECCRRLVRDLNETDCISIDPTKTTCNGGDK